MLKVLDIEVNSTATSLAPGTEQPSAGHVIAAACMPVHLMQVCVFIALVLTIGGQLAGYGQGIEWGETPVFVDPLVMVGLVLLVVNLVYAFFTSRGIGVVDVNYGGSTGYGREYRNRLRGQWGVVDVQDVVTAVNGLAEQGLADPARLAIEGGSAGGWTVLAALTTSDVFACGASYFGVAELDLFVQETHDFESRYVDGLIGPLPESADLYAERAPLNNVDGLNCPVLLLQGLDDPIVPPSQAERFRDALVAKGIPHAYLAYEGESHGFRKQSTIISSRNAELSFYGQVLRDRGYTQQKDGAWTRGSSAIRVVVETSTKGPDQVDVGVLEFSSPSDEP